MQLLAISGSLRSGASNTVLLEAAALIAAPAVHVALYDGLAALPPFNPDLDGIDSEPPPVVANLRAQVGRADGVLISSPEYAHGIPGSLKNLLDWLVASTEFPNKPVALLNTSPMSVHAPAQLKEILATMNARLVTEASVTIPIGRRHDATSVAADIELSTRLRETIAIFVRAIQR